MKYTKINNELFINNRALFNKKITNNDIAIFNSNDIMPTNADGTMPFRQNNDLFWLSGIDQEESVLAISPNHPNKKMREVLFLKETNEHIAIWDGAKLTKDDAFKTSAITTVFWLNELESKLAELISETDSIYLNKNIYVLPQSLKENNLAKFFAKKKLILGYGFNNFKKFNIKKFNNLNKNKQNLIDNQGIDRLIKLIIGISQ